jgi:hypothetical protein
VQKVQEEIQAEESLKALFQDPGLSKVMTEEEDL